MGDWDQAETCLNKAEQVARKFLQEDEAGEEEIEEEIGIIKVQLG